VSHLEQRSLINCSLFRHRHASQYCSNLIEEVQGTHCNKQRALFAIDRRDAMRLRRRKWGRGKEGGLSKTFLSRGQCKLHKVNFMKLSFRR
jgi:hypothetical protein